MQIITLDILDNQTYDKVYVKQYSKGFSVNVKITKGRNPFNLSGYTATFEMKKSNEDTIRKPCLITNNIISLEVDKDMTDVNGKAEFQIVLTKGNIKITTVTAIMKIERFAIN